MNLYNDGNISFTTDDLVFERNDRNIYFYLDVSRYFDVKYSVISDDGKAYYGKSKQIAIGKIASHLPINLFQFMKREHNVSHYSAFIFEPMNNFEFFPADYISHSLYWNHLTNREYSLHQYTREIRYKHNDNYRFIKRKYERLSKQFVSRMLPKNEWKKPYHKIIEKYNYLIDKKTTVSYKKFNSFDTIYSMPVFPKPIEFIAESILHSIYFSEAISFVDDIFYTLSEKKKYKLTRRLFILAMQKRYKDISDFILNEKKNLYINEKTFEKYSKVFSELYYAISSYTFRDIQNEDKLHTSGKHMSIENVLLPAIEDRIKNSLFSRYSEIKTNDDNYTYAFYRPDSLWSRHLAKMRNEPYVPENKLDCLVHVKQKL